MERRLHILITVGFYLKRFSVLDGGGWLDVMSMSGRSVSFVSLISCTILYAWLQYIYMLVGVVGKSCHDHSRGDRLRFDNAAFSVPSCPLLLRWRWADSAARRQAIKPFFSRQWRRRRRHALVFSFGGFMRARIMMLHVIPLPCWKLPYLARVGLTTPR